MSKHYPHNQTRECEFYEQKGVVTIPHVQQTIFYVAQNIFSAGLKY